MCARSLTLFICLFVGGCASGPRESAAEARGYERGYRQAVKEQYWLIQNQQRGPAQAAAPNPEKP
jgi:hypothetical protein